MSWVTVIWSMSAGVSVALAAVNLLVWLRDREALSSLIFSVCAFAAAALALLELSAMRAQTPAEYGIILRWMHLPAAIIVISLVWFLRSYLGTGRLWLAWLITGLRGLVLALNFLSMTNATFQDIHALREVYFLGETLFAPVGETNPWRFLTQLGMLLLLIYVLDAALAAWKLGKRRQALVLGTAVPLAIVVAVIFSGLMVRGILPGPFVVLSFLIILTAMEYELSVDLLSARQLSLGLRQSEERMRLASRAVDLSFWDWDINQDEIWTDGVGREMIGASWSENSSLKQYMSMIHPDDRKKVRQALDEAFEHNKDFEVDLRMTGEDGRQHWIAASGQIERGEKGEPLRMRGISMNITARKRLESELQKLHKELGHTQRVIAMGQLSAALAHELNQPLGAILRNAEAGELFLRQDRPDLEELRGIFVDIQRDDQRAAEVIDRMRALLRRRELRFEVIALDALIGQVADLLGSEMQARQVALHTTIPPKLPQVRADRVHLQQVLVNLLQNSMDALDEAQNGPRQMEVSAVELEGGWVELAVKDSGIGIDPDRLPDLFEPFVTTKREGTGIGLAVSKTIVEAHGGRIRAENNPGGGACIRFSLPVAPREGTA